MHLPVVLLALAMIQGISTSGPATVTSLADEPVTLPSITYPAEAKAARIQGTVELQVTVDATGAVTNVRALGGPPLLRQAAVDAYSQATYKPLVKDGRPTPAIVTTSVNFTLNELPPDTDMLVEKQFQPLHANCQELSLRRSPDALPTCRKALEIASHFTASAELEARAAAYNDLVLLLIAPGKYDGSGKPTPNPALPEANVLADQAIALMERAGQAGPHRPAAAIAYITRAEVRSLVGDLGGSAADCAQAEEVLSTLIADQAAPDQGKIDRTANYRGQLHEVLLLHAIVLERDHKGADARRLRHLAAGT